MPAGQTPTAHLIEFETQASETSYDGTPIELTLHRWRCSCGTPPGDWKTRAFQARQGASKHVAIAAKKTLDSASALPYTGRPSAKG